MVTAALKCSTVSIRVFGHSINIGHKSSLLVRSSLKVCCSFCQTAMPNIKGPLYSVSVETKKFNMDAKETKLAMKVPFPQSQTVYEFQRAVQHGDTLWSNLI